MSNQQEQQTIQALISTFIDGWNSGDGQLCAKPFAVDADFIAVTGQHAKGRDVIGKVHDEILATVFRGTRNSAHSGWPGSRSSSTTESGCPMSGFSDMG